MKFNIISNDDNKKKKNNNRIFNTFLIFYNIKSNFFGFFARSSSIFSAVNGTPP
jgi:hypothetical protein